MTGRFFFGRVEGPRFRDYGFITRRGERILFRCTIDGEDASLFLDPDSPATHLAFDEAATLAVSIVQISTTSDERGERFVIGEHAAQPEQNSPLKGGTSSNPG